MKKGLFSFLAVMIYANTAFSQISEGGTPPSFKYPSVLRSGKAPYTVKVDLDIDKLLAEDSISAFYGEPVRIATILPANIDMKSDGEWTTLPNNDRIWRQTIYAKGARALIISYKEFYIPEGGKLFIYNKDHSMLLGAFSENTNPEGGSFSTQIIVGDEIILEYVDSKISTESPQIVVEDVGYVYKSLFNEMNTRETPKPGDSASCMIDVNCEEGQDWQSQKRGVVFISVKQSSGWGGCSGSLINNVNNDGTPYLLTASHCFSGNNYLLSQFYFNYEYKICKGNTIESLTQSITGSEMLVNSIVNGGSDGVLLKLKQNVPLTYLPYFNGWNANDIAPKSGVIIHHPQKDVKKISTFNKTAKSSAWNINQSNTHWEITYATTINGRSITAGGSSGSPLFNQEGLIVGTLSGGNSFCYNNSPDLYGKFAYHWNKLGSDMQSYLDPTNKLNKLKGYDPNGGESIETEKETKPINMVLFPNPAETDLNVNARGIIKSLFIYNLLGHLVYSSRDMQSSTTVVPVSAWDRGIYTVVVETGEGNHFTEKFIKK